jgi:hypothetical protein
MEHIGTTDTKIREENRIEGIEKSSRAWLIPKGAKNQKR